MASAWPCLVAREGVEQDRLAQRHERRAEHALGQAEHDHALEVPGQAAQHDDATKPVMASRSSRLRPSQLER